jgi:hypothetical protein
MFVSAIETKLLTDALATAEGTVVTYADLSKIVGANLTTSDRLRSCLNSARRKLVKEQHIHFAVVRGVGLKRITHADVVERDDTAAKIRRMARRGLRKITAVDYDDLPHSSQVRHQAKVAVLAAIEAVSTKKAVKVIEAKVTPQTHLPLAATLEAFREMNGKA